MVVAMASAKETEKVVIDEFIQKEPPNPFSHTSTLVELEPGVTLASWVGGPVARDPKNSIWLARRDKGGWTQPGEIAKHEGVASWNPILWKDKKSAQLVLFYKIGTSPETWTGAIKRSTDDGKTWSETEILPAGLTGCIRSKPFELDDGTLVCGDSVEAWQSWACWVNITKDLGKTWTRHGPVIVPGKPHGIIQPTIFWADAKKTTLRMLARPTEEIGRVCMATSKDFGLTWTPASPIGLETPNSAIDAVQLRDGRVALVHNLGTKSKGVLAVSLSSDGGLTFSEAVRIQDDPEAEYVYPCMIQDAAGRLQVAYTWKKVNIRYVVIELAPSKP